IWLKLRGIQVTMANDGTDAIEQMEKGFCLDVIISDIEMPSMDGFALFQTVRAKSEWSSIPFIILSGHEEKSELRRELALGVDEYLLKPIDKERLFSGIESKAKRREGGTPYIDVKAKPPVTVERSIARIATPEPIPMPRPFIAEDQPTEMPGVVA